MSHDVFISYSSHDKAVADATCAALEAQKIRCWIAPRDVLAGADYGASIISGISDCRALVLIFSGHANKSEHVQNELERAFHKEKLIVPFRIEDVAPANGLEYWLSRRHWLDALTPPLEMRIAELVRSIGHFLEATPRQPAIAPVVEARSDRSRNPQARACHDRGVARYRHQEYDQAIVELSEAIRIDPTVAWAYNDRGSAWLQKCDFAKAINDFNEGLRLDPSHAWPFHDRGTALFKSGDLAAAIRDYTTALQLDPTLAWSHHDRGACHLQLGQFAEAIADFTAAIRLNPELIWAYRNRATAYEQSGQAELARADHAAVRRLESPPDDVAPATSVPTEQTFVSPARQSTSPSRESNECPVAVTPQTDTKTSIAKEKPAPGTLPADTKTPGSGDANVPAATHPSEPAQTWFQTLNNKWHVWKRKRQASQLERKGKEQALKVAMEWSDRPLGPGERFVVCSGCGERYRFRQTDLRSAKCGKCKTTLK